MRHLRLRERIATGNIVICFGALFLAALVHPLMGAYALGCVLVLAIACQGDHQLQWASYAGLCVVAVAAAGLLIVFAPETPPDYAEVARTRTYWFLSQWHWYEMAGLIAPLLVLGFIRFQSRNISTQPMKSFAHAGLIVGLLSIVVVVLFARVAMSCYAVAKLQPLRVFQTVYVITIISIGALISQHILKHRKWRWVGMVAGVGAIMLFVQLRTFPNSGHLEFPWDRPTNEWEQAFTWIRTQTPTNAAFALDADYINAPREDSQNFRAIAERSVVPDYSKDGGIASIAPDLTVDWIEGESAQTGLDRATDADRMKALRALSVQWVVLSAVQPPRSHAIT